MLWYYGSVFLWAKSHHGLSWGLWHYPVSSVCNSAYYYINNTWYLWFMYWLYFTISYLLLCVRVCTVSMWVGWWVKCAHVPHDVVQWVIIDGHFIHHSRDPIFCFLSQRWCNHFISLFWKSLQLRPWCSELDCLESRTFWKPSHWNSSSKVQPIILAYHL